jgi:hypothetical protein
VSRRRSHPYSVDNTDRSQIELTRG